MSEALQAPLEVYRQRLDERRRAVAVHRRKEIRVAYLRLVIFLAGSALVWPVLYARSLAWLWFLPPALAFFGALYLHQRVKDRRIRAARAVRFYERALARLDDRWAGEGTPGDEYLEAAHPYAENLDIFGRGSLFELLCLARTRSGEQTLARWLAEGAAPDVVRARQEAVDELRDRLGLREELAVLGEEVRADDDPEGLAAWAGSPPVLPMRWPVPVAIALAIFNYASLLVWAVTPVGGPLFVVASIASCIFAFLLRRRVEQVLAGVERPEHELELLSSVLARLEQEQFRTPRLRELRAMLDTDGLPASRRIQVLARWVELRDSRDNLIFRPFAALMLLGTQLAFAMERWRRRSSADVSRWIAAVGEIEALGSLAAAAYEHPDDPFPEIVEQGPLFEADGLGHPLLPDSSCIRNDVRLGPQLQLLLVSGSNMSGKTTLLRSVGANTVLALAGAPVRARRMRVSPLNIGACLRVQDSLQDGVSHFYAEITRLRIVFDRVRESRPLLFLLDEILAGTNSHDRRIGADALIRGLVDHGAIGLVTTHDLALAQIAEDLAPRAENVHFEDHLEGERIVFDYKLKPGVVRRSNALPLMRAIGLKV